MPDKKMYNSFTELIDAICYWLGYQENIGRKKLIHEASLRYPLADALTKNETSITKIKLENTHPLFKSKRVDLAILVDENDKSSISKLHEFKIAKYTSEFGDEHQNVFDDVVRLAYYNMVTDKDCYFLMCGSYDNFRHYFVGDKPKPEQDNDGVKIKQRIPEITGWKPDGVYKGWFKFEQGDTEEKEFSIDHDSESDWGLESFKKRYILRDGLESTDFYNSDSITIKTTCMAVSPFNNNKTHATGIWKIEMK